jgi:hypothetical protein
MTTPPPQPEHSPTLSPSSAHRWLACPGSSRLIASMPEEDEEPSQYALEGHAAHALAQASLVIDTDPMALVGMTGESGVTVTEEMAEHVAAYVDEVLADVKATEGLLWVEPKIGAPSVHPDLYGAPDAVVWGEDDVLRIYDLKYGAGVLVPVTDNAQLLIYALAAIETLGGEGDDYEPPVAIEMVIVQPRRMTEDDDGELQATRRWRISIEDFRHWVEKTLVPGVEAVYDELPVYRPSKAACRWCDAAPICGAFKDAALEGAREVFALPVIAAGTPLPEDPKSLGIGKITSSLTSDRLARILSLAPMLRHWLDVVESHAHARLHHGETLPGFKLVERFGHRAWTASDFDVASVLLESDVHPFQPQKLITPAQAEKLLPKEKKPTIETLASRPSRGTLVVPVSDKRPAVARNAATVFGTDAPDPDVSTLLD